MSASSGPASVFDAPSVSHSSAYWEHSRDHKGSVRHKVPPYDESDPVTWVRLMQQHLRITGMGDTITKAPVFGGHSLRARPSDAGESWEQINSANLGDKETAAFVRCTDAFTTITQALSSAPPAFRQIAVTIEDGNAKALWEAVKKYIEETRGETGTRLLAKLVAARMRSDETPLQYGVRLQSELTTLRAHGKDLDEDLLKDRFVNFMSPAHADTARHLALLRKKSTLAELIDAAAEIGAIQASTAAPQTTQQKSSGKPLRHGNAVETLKKGCFVCGAHDHIKQNCPQSKGKESDGRRQGSGDRSTGGNRLTCEFCQKVGHSTERCFTLERAEKVIRERNAKSGSGRKPAAEAQVAESMVQHAYVTVAEIGEKRLLDSAASRHMQNASLPVMRDLGVADEKIRIATGEILNTPRKADVEVDLADGSSFQLKEVLTHPELRTSLVSVGALLEDPAVASVSFERDGAEVKNTRGKVVMTARRENGVFVVNTADSPMSEQEDSTMLAAPAESGPSGLELWHRRACHLSDSTLADTARTGAVIEGERWKKKAIASGSPPCEPCLQGKQKRNPVADVKRSELKARRVLERLYMDLSGPYTPGLEGQRYRLNIVDEYSGEGQVLFSCTKKEIPSLFITWAKMTQNKRSLVIAELHFDGGGEFVNDAMKGWCKQNGTDLTWGPTETPFHNGRAERFIQTIDNLQSAAMHAAGAPEHLWVYASAHAVAAYNRFMVSQGDPSRTRHQVFFDIKEPISVSEFKVWGCRAYARRLPESGDSKLASKSIACSNLGYNYSRSSYTMIDDHGHIFQSRDVRFDETSFAGMRELTDDDDDADDRPAVGRSHVPREAVQPKGDLALAQLLSRSEQLQPQVGAGSESAGRIQPNPQLPSLEFEFNENAFNEESGVADDPADPHLVLEDDVPDFIDPVDSMPQPSNVSDESEDDAVNEPQYIVEKISGKRTTKKAGEQFKVHWRGYAKPTWEPAEAIRAQVPDFVKDFEDPSEPDDEEDEKSSSGGVGNPAAGVDLTPGVSEVPPAGATNSRPRRGNQSFHRLGMADMRDYANAALVMRPVSPDYSNDVDRQQCHDDATKTRASKPGDPPMRLGQVQMPSQRCTAEVKKGGRCGAKTRHGQYCWVHLKQLCSIRIKPVGAPINGKGIFAERDYKVGETVSVYSGDLIQEHRDEFDNGSHYVLQISARKHIDAARTNTAPARLANDPRGTGSRANCHFVANPRMTTARLVTFRPVKKGEQFFVSYGAQYWSARAQGKQASSKASYGTRNNPIVVNVAEAHVAVTDIHPESERLGDPLSYDAILRRPDKEQWLAAHALEHEAQMKNGTYVIVPKSSIPPGTRLLTWKDVYKLKTGPDGRPAKYKARFTVRGCAQTPEQYGDITAYVFSLRSLRVVCALVAQYDWEFKQLDVDAAYLHGDLKEELYAVAPKGLGIPADHAVKLKKTIYGLKQAAHEWQQKLFLELAKLKYEALRWSDRCMFLRRLKNGRVLIIMVYVDDIPYAYDKRDEQEMLNDIKSLRLTFPTKDLGEAEYILGWRITRDRKNRKLMLDQEGHIQHLLEEYGLDQCVPAETPGTAIGVLNGTSTPAESSKDKKALSEVHLHPQAQLKEYRSIVGSLQYLTSCTLPVIADAVNKLAHFNADPQPRHLRALKKVLRYLSGHRGDRLTYTGTPQSGVPIVTAYSDSDWAEDPVTRKSTTGWVVMLCGAAISWRSKRQSTVARSTMEAEYVAAASLVDELISVRRLLSELGCHQPGPTLVRIDSTAAIAVAKEGGKEERRKHIDVKHHCIVEAIDEQIIQIKFVPSKDNIADLFTKPLHPEARFTLLKDVVLGQATLKP